MKQPQTDFDTLVLALRLAVTAPTDSLAEECTFIAEELAFKLGPKETERAKKIVEELKQ